MKKAISVVLCLLVAGGCSMMKSEFIGIDGQSASAEKWTCFQSSENATGIEHVQDDTGGSLSIDKMEQASNADLATLLELLKLVAQTQAPTE